MPFKVWNHLLQTHYLKAVFPYALHYQQTDNIPLGVTARMAKGYNCTQQDFVDVAIFVLNEKDYYFTLIEDLVPNQRYILQVQTVGNNLNI